MKYLYLLLLLLPITCFAQFTIKGKVVNVADGKPVPDASVFINNTTIGAKADTNGFFKLHNLKQGQYELIVSAVGYETNRQALVVNKDMVLPDINMQSQILTANEVSIVARDPKRARKLRMFIEQFLGRAVFWRDCKILNPQVLKLVFSQHQQVLTASTRDFLEIENDALGYKLKYLLTDFVLDRNALNMKYEGFALFEETAGTPEQKEKWEKNRREVYYGSPTHFLRAVLANKVDTDFMVRPFCMKPLDTVKGKNILTGDASDYLMIRYDTLKTKNYVHRTDKPGVYAIGYSSDLEVFYYKPGVKHFRDNQGQEFGNRGQVGSIDFIDKDLFFDINGTILNPTGTSFRYQWGTNRIAELLPIDYWPPDREDKRKVN